MANAVCCVCWRELHRRIQPDFMMCDCCGVASRAADTLAKEPDRLNVYSENWVEGHSNNPIAHFIAESTAQVVHKVPPRGGKIIDIGCGSGLLVDKLARMGYKATGLDWSEPAIEYARKHYQGEYILANVEQGFNLGRTFDLAVASHILEHLENPHEFLKSVAGILEPNGYLVIAVPNLAWYDPKSIYRSVSTIFDPEHVAGYSPRGVKKLLEINGYKVEFMTTRTHRLAILNAIGINVYKRLFRGKGNQGAKSGYVKATSGGLLVKLLAWGMKPLNRISEWGLKGMELIVVARKEKL